MSYNWIDTISTSSSPKLSWGQWIKAGWAMFKADAAQLGMVMMVWQKRAQERRAMKSLSDEILADIGVSRAEMNLQADKPFWRS